MKKINFVLAAVTLLACIPSQACGPRFYETILDMSFAILRAPESSFDFELSQMTPELGPLPGGLNLSSTVQEQARITKQLNEEVLTKDPLLIIDNTEGCRTKLLACNLDFARDVAEVAGFLQDPNQLKEYIELRAKMLLSDKDIGALISAPAQKAALDAIAKRDWPDFLPAEFHHYLSGAADFSEKNYDAAIGHFTKLLALPVEERRFRSTWAAYMAGRAELAKGDEELKRSLAYFRRVSAEREAGCHDVLKLGWDVLGIEADFLEMTGVNDDARKALRYRFALAWQGEGKSISTMRDFRYRVRSLVKSGQAEIFGRDDAFLRQVFTAAVMNSRGEIEYWKDEQAQKSDADGWLAFLKSVALTSDEAPRAANFAYMRGELETASQFLKQAKYGNPTAILLRAKLKSKSRQFRTASRTLEKAEAEFSRPLDQPIPRFDSEWRFGASLEDIADHRTSQFWGNRGILHLASDEMVPALEALLRSGHWRDAAYVAEQLISREQLLTYVRDKWPTQESATGLIIPNKIRYLTARRLARDRYFKDARDFFPARFVDIFDVYVKNYRTFRDRSKSDDERAEAGWAAAQIHRRLGMELFGTEVGPDYTCFGGSYGSRWFDYGLNRMNFPINSRFAESVWHFRNPKTAPIEFSSRELENIEQQKQQEFFPPATGGEIWAHRKYAKLPNVYRWHYRHVAADLAWETALLLPDNTEEKAQMMNTAGKWLAGRHPQNADFFYKALVNKNRNTTTGPLADVKRWFVKDQWWDEYDPWLEHGIVRAENRGW